MMKRTILFGLASAALLAVGCTNDETVEIPATKAITFADAFVNNNTKADPSTKLTTLTAFNVYGYVTTTEGKSQIFKGDDVTKSGSDWTYTDTQYWIDGGSYVFSAVAPTGEGATTDLSDGVITTTISSFESDGETDLIYATATATGKASGNNAVGLTFNHLLSKVKFTFVNGFPTTSNISLNVKDVTISDAVKAAKVEADGTKTTWTLPETVSKGGLVFGSVATLTKDADDKDVEELTAIAPTKDATAINEKLLIPTTDVDYTVTFNVALLQGGSNLKIKEYPVTATIKGQTFEPGNVYNITATLTEKNVNPDGTSLESIKFTVSGVNGWNTPDKEGTAVPEATKK
jgi:hypothetical protein